MKVGYGSCNASFGELVQGEINGQSFLITLPINKRSYVTFTPNRNSKLVTCSTGKEKAVSASQRLLSIHGKTYGGELSIYSEIAPGKGMASSTADIIAALRALADHLSVKLDPTTISKIAIEIEPTDGLMYEGVNAYDYINGELIEHMGLLPDMFILGIDYGGEIDTLLFHEQLTKQYTVKEQEHLHEAYELVKDGVRFNQVASIFKGMTISTKINQRFLSKPHLSELLKLADLYKGGIITAHSGTVVGLCLHHRLRKKGNVIFNELKKITGIAPFLVETNVQYKQKKVGAWHGSSSF